MFYSFASWVLYFRNRLIPKWVVTSLVLGIQLPMPEAQGQSVDERAISIPKSTSNVRVLPCCDGFVDVTNQAALEEYRKQVSSARPPTKSSDETEDSELRRVLKSREWFKTFPRVGCVFGLRDGDYAMLTQEKLIKPFGATLNNDDASALYGDTTLIHYDGIVNYYPGFSPFPLKQERSSLASKFDATRNISYPELFVAFRVTPISREGYFRIEIGTLGGIFRRENPEIFVDATMIGKMTDSGLELGSSKRGYIQCKWRHLFR